MHFFEKIKKEIFDIYRYRYVTYSFIQTNLKLRYRRSYLGFIWTVLAPLLNYLIIGIVFTLLMTNRMDNFFVYYFTGAVFFTVISNTLNRAPGFLIGNERFIKKIYLPKLIFILNGTLYEVANFILSVFSLLILGIMSGYLSLNPTMPITIIPVFLIIILLIGISSLISVGSVYFRDLTHIVPAMVQSLFFITPVIYEKSMIPERYHFLITLNPIYYYLELFRQPIVYGTLPPLNYYLICFVFSLTVFFIGITVVKKFDNRIVFKL